MSVGIFNRVDLRKKEDDWYQQANGAQDCYVQHTHSLYSVS